MKAILAAVLVLCCRLPVFSQQPQPADPHAAVLAVAGFLQFSETQTARFVQAFDNFQSTMHDLQTQIASRQQQLEQVIRSSQPSTAVIGQLLLEIYALQSKGGDVITQYHNAFIDLLSPEQLQKTQIVSQARNLVPAVAVFAAASLIEPPR